MEQFEKKKIYIFFNQILDTYIKCECPRSVSYYELYPDSDGINIKFFEDHCLYYGDKEYNFKITFNNVKLSIVSGNVEVIKNDNNFEIKTKKGIVEIHIKGFYDVLVKAGSFRLDWTNMMFELTKRDIDFVYGSKIYGFSYEDKVCRTEIINGSIHIKIPDLSAKIGIHENSNNEFNVICLNQDDYKHPQKNDIKLNFEGFENYNAQLLFSEHIYYTDQPDRLIQLINEYYMISHV